MQRTGGEKAAEKYAPEYERKPGSLAVQVLEACRNQLFFRYRFLEQALFRLEWEETAAFSFGSDGRKLYYDWRYILKRYAGEPEQMMRDYLHTVIHCLYQHFLFFPAERSGEQETCRHLAADISVEWVLEELEESKQSQKACFTKKEAELRREILQRLREEAGVMSAQKALTYLQEHITADGLLFGVDVQRLRELFGRDEHTMWCRRNGPIREEGAAEVLRRIWKETAARVLMEARAAACSGRGDAAGGMVQALKKLTMEKQDYSEFLMKFAAHTEERMQADENEFDAVFYTYGLKQYGTVPLIEPLEYREKRLIREFVIAIDTSASCQGKIVERFLVRTFQLLRQSDSFASRMNIHIIQCDARIQEAVRIESLQELEEYMAHLTLKGFGGTDFTPVFTYVNLLLETGGIGRPDGLLYFTDGYGRFPSKPPGYKTAFVFLNKEEDVQVPPWAMKVFLDL